jgi:acetyl esterase/lipase
MARATCLAVIFAVGGLFPFVASFQSTLPSDLPQSTLYRLQMADTQTEPKTNGSPRTSDSSSSSSRRKELAVVGKVGNWEELQGNWILRPPQSDEPPRALLHFLGGAMVGAAPHITYRYMLERLAEKGFLVVATPYQLSFDHLETCDEVITKFEAMAPTIARQYGALPVVGIGHSCGALLQLLITCLFPDTPRAANALISFNNKPVTDAIPFFEEVFAPFFTTIAAKNGTFPSSNEAISLSLQLAKAATEGTTHYMQKKCRISNMP